MIDLYPPGETGSARRVELTLTCRNAECETEHFVTDGYRELGAVHIDDPTCPECGEDGEDE